MLGVEVTNGGEELRSAHDSTHPLPRTSARAVFSDMPSWTSLRMRCSCSTVADSPTSGSKEGGSTEVTEELKLLSGYPSRGCIFLAGYGPFRAVASVFLQNRWFGSSVV